MNTKNSSGNVQSSQAYKILPQLIYLLIIFRIVTFLVIRQNNYSLKISSQSHKQPLPVHHNLG